MNGASMTTFCVTFLNMSVQRNQHNLRNGRMHLPRTTAPMVNSTKAFFLKKVLTSSLVMSSTFFLAFRERSWMSSRIRCTRLRERGFSPLLLVMAVALNCLYPLYKSAVWPDRANPKLPDLKCSQDKKGHCFLHFDYLCMNICVSSCETVSTQELWKNNMTTASSFIEARNKKHKQNEAAMSRKNNGFWLAGVHLIA